ncbi:MAG: M3 family metallopeptidase, partial [Cyclobacteriaceae bacterium]
QKEIEEIKQFMKEHGADHELQRWDWSYYSEKLRKKKYNLDDELIKPYFKLENVIEGVFTTAQKLYGLSFRRNTDIPVYHEDVSVYEVMEEGELKAIFYADFFPRKGKRGGAWMTSYRDQRKLINGERVIPQISIVCNFTPSTEDSPSLLKFIEVKTLFHEFGHALHGMLADTTFESLSGTSVYWDFVELPSQIFENWCYEKECLDLFAKHYKTNELIPEEYVIRLKESATYHEAYATLRQVSFGLLDMAYHTGDGDINDVAQLEEKALDSTNLFPKVEGTSMSTQFSHIFAGGYGAGYYSYKWAEVLDADAFSLFKEKGLFDKQTAASFKENILSKGGTEPPMELYKKFRGSEPKIDALLKRAGLEA